MYTYWQICTIHQQTVTSVTSMEMLQTQESYRIRTGIWGMETMGKKWRTVTWYNAKHGSRWRNYFLTCRTWQLWLSLMRNLIEKAGSLHFRPMGRPVVLEKQATGLAVNFSNHRQVWTSRLYCHICSTQGIKRRVQVMCKDCDVEFGIHKCFETYNTPIQGMMPYI
jgi:hypothetical protein